MLALYANDIQEKQFAQKDTKRPCMAYANCQKWKCLLVVSTFIFALNLLGAQIKHANYTIHVCIYGTKVKNLTHLHLRNK